MAFFSPTAKQFSPLIFFKQVMPASKSSMRKSEDEQDYWDLSKAPPALAEFYKHFWQTQSSRVIVYFLLMPFSQVPSQKERDLGVIVLCMKLGLSQNVQESELPESQSKWLSTW